MGGFFKNDNKTYIRFPHQLTDGHAENTLYQSVVRNEHCSLALARTAWGRFKTQSNCHEYNDIMEYQLMIRKIDPTWNYRTSQRDLRRHDTSSSNLFIRIGLSQGCRTLPERVPPVFAHLRETCRSTIGPYVRQSECRNSLTRMGTLAPLL